MIYLLLQNPGHNWVYYTSSDKLAFAELSLASVRLSVPANDIQIKTIENIRYLSLETAATLNEKDIDLLSRLSFVFAVFQLEDSSGTSMLRPIAKSNFAYMDPKISSVQKYKGKTNELFTRLMISVGIMSMDFDYQQKISMLDPVAGRGTTLFEGSVHGFDLYGIELDGKAVHEAAVFFRKYLEAERIKHKQSKRQVAGKSRSEAIMMQQFEYALSKEDFKSPEKIKKLGLVHGNTADADQYFRKNQFHLIVGDLPYGVQHGNTTGRAKSFTRNPSELLHECLPAWKTVLKPGGAVVIAWNSFLASPKKLAAIFTELGFEVKTEAPYNQFEHMVDHSIKRDVLVALKK